MGCKNVYLLYKGLDIFRQARVESIEQQCLRRDRNMQYAGSEEQLAQK